MKKKVLLVVATILVVVIGLCVLAGCGQSRGNMIKNKDNVSGFIYLTNGNLVSFQTSETQKIYETSDTITIAYKDESGKVVETIVINKDNVTHIQYVEENR